MHQTVGERGLVVRGAHRRTLDGLDHSEGTDVLVEELRAPRRLRLTRGGDRPPHGYQVVETVLRDPLVIVSFQLSLRRFLQLGHHGRLMHRLLQLLLLTDVVADARELRSRGRLSRLQTLEIRRGSWVKEVKHEVGREGEVGKRRNVVGKGGLLEALIPLLIS
jgi:hypothetical protein